MFAVSSHKSTVAAWKAIYCEHKHVLYICYMQLATSLRQLFCYSRKFWNMVCTSLWNKMFCQECCWYWQYSSRQRATKCRVLPHLLKFFFWEVFYLQAQNNLFGHLLPLHLLPSTRFDIQSCLTQLLLPLAWPSSWSSPLQTPLSQEAPGLNWRHLTGAQAQGWEEYASKRTMPVIQKDDRMVWHFLGVQTP